MSKQDMAQKIIGFLKSTQFGDHLELVALAEEAQQRGWDDLALSALDIAMMLAGEDHREIK